MIFLNEYKLSDHQKSTAENDKISTIRIRQFQLKQQKTKQIKKKNHHTIVNQSTITVLFSSIKRIQINEKRIMMN
jgi:hypothetical protein